MKFLSVIMLIISFSVSAEGISIKTKNSNDQKQIVDAKPCQLGDLEPSPSSPPNNTDDPGITDTGCWEINHTFAIDHAMNSDGSKSNFNDYALDMNYGAMPGLQAKVVIHYNSQDIYDINDPYSTSSSASALGRIEVGAKKRIYENEDKNLTISLFPTIDFMAPGSPAAARGLPDSGTNLTLPVLVSKKFGPVVVVSDAGVVMSLSDSNKPAQIILSTSAGINISKDTIVTGEVYRTSGTDFRSDATTSVGVGVSTKLSENTLLYMSLGKSIGDTADGGSHVYALAGVKVLFGKGSRDSKEFRFNFKNPNEEESY